MRCAIYTRKSADEAIDTQHSSIETQRNLCEKYVASQAGEGWVIVPTRYDDLGASGGSLKRSALTRLLADIDAGLVDVVVVYKIDRLSRSLRDFLNLMEVLNDRGVTFVSITQSFSTTTSVGRLTLNVLLSFAQFERELMGERRKDWIAGARMRGLWTSGPAPFGYALDNLRLVVHPERAELVRLVFRAFPRTRSAGTIADQLNDAGHRNRFGRTFDGRTVKRMLTNRVYRGDLKYRGELIAGTHEAIITEASWRRAQTILAATGGAGLHSWQRDRKPQHLTAV
ncbi:recombinase family protein [Sphingomonas montana]|uniref:recombinase family protein n=1 Tax=Sphingomonas montana TaxID=1843236 RepID=UPI00097003AB|nr:recombinase family protein [Sphingomonas montana]